MNRCQRSTSPGNSVEIWAEDVNDRSFRERLEKLDRASRFDSIERFVDIQIACAGRTDESGKLAMGLVDLEDERWLPGIDAFLGDARTALAPYVEGGTLVAPFVSDEMSARS